jgi:tartrate-resistant acid phosphatase type 5
MFAHLRLATTIALGVFGASSTAASAPSNFPTTTPLRFIIVGDTGTGEPGQYAVASALGAVCAKRGCQFAIALGDNIYKYGASDPKDVQFQDKFEKPYAKLSFPFFMVLGNHDQSGLIPGSGVHPEQGDHEVEYTQLSSKWMLPSRYYKFGVPFASATDFYAQVAQPVIEFFAIDTNYLAPQDRPTEDWYRPNEAYDQAQRTWLRDGLAASHASWKVVFGHHPDRNNGKHGNAGEFFGLGLAKGEDLKKFYQEEVCGKADLLISGHDHSLQWLAPQASCGARPQFLISGAGADTYSWTPSAKEPNPRYWEAFGTLGFFWAEATADRLTLTAYTVDAKGTPTLAFQKALLR